MNTKDGCIWFIAYTCGRYQPAAIHKIFGISIKFREDFALYIMFTNKMNVQVFPRSKSLKRTLQQKIFLLQIFDH